jgi:hypothetical protein
MSTLHVIKSEPLLPLTRADVEDVARRTATRIEMLLRATGRTFEPEADDGPPPDVPAEKMLVARMLRFWGTQNQSLPPRQCLKKVSTNEDLPRIGRVYRIRSLDEQQDSSPHFEPSLRSAKFR